MSGALVQGRAANPDANFDVLNLEFRRVSSGSFLQRYTPRSVAGWDMCHDAVCVWCSIRCRVDHPLKGQSIYAFVTLRGHDHQNNAMRKTLMDHVRK